MALLAEVYADDMEGVPPESWARQYHVGMQISFWAPRSLQKDLSSGVEGMAILTSWGCCGLRAFTADAGGRAVPETQVRQGEPGLSGGWQGLKKALLDPTSVRLPWALFPASPPPWSRPAQCSQRILLSHPPPMTSDQAPYYYPLKYAFLASF